MRQYQFGSNYDYLTTKYCSSLRGQSFPELAHWMAFDPGITSPINSDRRRLITLLIDLFRCMPDVTQFSFSTVPVDVKSARAVTAVTPRCS